MSRATRAGCHRPQYHPMMPSEPAAQQLPELIDVPLGANRDFKVLLTSQGISSLGDGVSFAALPLLVLALTTRRPRQG